MYPCPKSTRLDKASFWAYSYQMNRQISFILLIAVFLPSCTSSVTIPTETVVPASSGVLPPVASAENIPLETPVTNCADEQVNRLGESITSSYDFTSPQEVMTWFCSGADLEDILVALETEELVGTPAEDLLQMRADGLSWDEIWQVTGLFDQ